LVNNAVHNAVAIAMLVPAAAMLNADEVSHVVMK